MSFLQFSEDQYWKTFDTGERILMGSFSTATNGQLSAIRVLYHVQGISNLGGSESLTLKVYSDELLTKELYSSSVSAISSISASDSSFGTTENWIGYIKMDFNRENINKNLTYYLGMEHSNYTRSSSLIAGLCYDFPFPIYDNGATKFFEHNIAFQIFMFQE